MAFMFPAGFDQAVDRLGAFYNPGNYNATTNPGGFGIDGHRVNFVPALSNVSTAAQGLAAFADYLNGTVSPLAQSAVDAATAAGNAAGSAIAAATAAGQDRTATGQDRVATGQDKTATAADRVVTGQDRTATGQDKVATAADRVATGQDKTATAADRVQTGQDRAAAAASANKLSGTSSTSNAIGTGAKTFTTQADKFFGAGSTVTISSDSNPSGVQMSGVVTGYSGVTLVINAQRTAGTGTYTDWTIRVSGAAGSNGSSGWTPVFANATRGADIVQRIVDWTGGSGTKPTTGSYVGPTGFVENIADATNVRGLAGAGGGNVNPSGTVDTNHVALFSDATGNLIKSGGLLADVASSGEYADLAGTPTIPTVPGDIGAAEEVHDHVAADITDASANGRALLTAANYAAMRTLLAFATVASSGAYADLTGKPTIPSTPGEVGAAAASHTHPAAQISDASANGRSILTAADYAAVRTLLGLVIGTNVQAYDADLASIAALTTQAFGRSTLTVADAGALRTLAGLSVGSDVQAYDADLTAIAALATTTFGRDLLTLADATALLTAAGGLAAASKATAAQRRSLTSDTVYNTPLSDADAMALVYETVTGTKAIDWSLGWNRGFNITGNLTLGQHTGLKDGQSGIAYFIQDATGSRTLVANTTYNKFAGGTMWVLSTAANAVDRAGYVLRLRGGVLVTEWGGLEKGIA